MFRTLGFVIVDQIREAVAEPRAPDPPVWKSRSWLLVLVAAVLGFVSYFVDRPGPVWLFAAVAVSTAAALRFRHREPVAAVAFVLLVPIAASWATEIVGDGASLIEASSFSAIVAVWSLCRWASGREAVTGLAIVLGSAFVFDTTFGERSAPLTALGSWVPWLLLATVALVVRYRSTLRRRAVDDARSSERESLARELHDTVAHHVSAIAIHAQAGQLIAQSESPAAAEVLRTIERSASETLAEMRRMVGALRESGLNPQATLADVEALADADSMPCVEVDVSGLGPVRDDLGPAVQASVYRIVQESVTNARRHARHATRVRVTLTAVDDRLQLRIRDDGDRVASSGGGDGGSGFGLVGMAERVELLGGTFSAGPADGRGWLVAVDLPLAPS